MWRKMVLLASGSGTVGGRPGAVAGAVLGVIVYFSIYFSKIGRRCERVYPRARRHW